VASVLTLVAFSTPFLDSIPPEQLDSAVQALAGTIPPGTPEHTDLVERIDVRDDLAAIRVPTLVISTAGDPLVSPDLHRQLAAEIPGAQLAEIDTGHLPSPSAPRSGSSSSPPSWTKHSQAL
jgi:pimeloyl-ACP methyl ester carboxylesterase